MAVTSPQLFATPNDCFLAAELIRSGRGPLAIDTERASGYRYDDRAFLIQMHRRDAGTILIDPEGHREAVTEAFAQLLGELDWIVHASPSDLPSLAALGLYPGGLFDTELAGRLAGLTKVNLAAMVERFTGVTLEKGHGAEDWSTRPLPTEWLRYAADDVVYLIDLAESMTELLDGAGKLAIAEQEFEYIMAEHRHPPSECTWRDVKGASTLRAPKQLAVLRHLHEVRDSLGRRDDIAPTRLLATKTMVDLARTLPRKPADLSQVNGGHRLRGRRASMWLEQIAQAVRTDPAEWPTPESRHHTVPSRTAWPESDPESWEIYCSVRNDITDLAERISIPVENLLKPALLRAAVWHTAAGGRVSSAEQLRRYLHEHSAREWQIELVAPLIGARVF